MDGSHWGQGRRADALRPHDEQQDLNPQCWEKESAHEGVLWAHFFDTQGVRQGG
jgi:hypothetical protein